MTMEFPVSFSFFTILTESIKLVPRNGKLMVLIGVVSVILHSAFVLLFNYSIQSLAMDLILSFMPNPTSLDNVSDPTSSTNNAPELMSPRLKRDVALVLCVEIAFVLSMCVVLFFSIVSIIIASAASYRAKTLSIKEFSSIIGTAWMRPFVTYVYVLGLTIAYVFLVAMLATPLVILNSHITIGLAITIGIAAFAFYMYLSVPWALAMVISMVEENCNGIDALGKGVALAKGKRLHGFLLNVAYNLVGLIVVHGLKMALGSKWLMNHGYVSVLFTVVIMYAAKFFLVVAYTVLFFDCKKLHGEEVELNGSLEYTKLPTTQTGK